MLQKYWPLLALIGVGVVVILMLNQGGEPPRPTRLQTEDVKVGDGPEAKAGDTVLVHYTGRLLKNGVKFDSSLDRGEPFKFTLDRGQVIPGWDEGVAGMKAGGKRKLTIPAKLGYGRQGHGKIPPDADLEFDVELIKIVPTRAGLAELKKEDVKVGDGPEAKPGNKLRVHYTGRLMEDGTVFDSSLKRGEPFVFTLGQRQVIAGWDEGVVGMKVGGKRKLQIPSRMGYGRGGSPPSIPSDADLEFDIELLEIVQ